MNKLKNLISNLSKKHIIIITLLLVMVVAVVLGIYLTTTKPLLVFKENTDYTKAGKYEIMVSAKDKNNLETISKYQVVVKDKAESTVEETDGAYQSQNNTSNNGGTSTGNSTTVIEKEKDDRAPVGSKTSEGYILYKWYNSYEECNANFGADIENANPGNVHAYCDPSAAGFYILLD